MKKKLPVIPFVKMSGAGNDFIIIDHRNALLSMDEVAQFARLVCRRRFSVGADGLFLIEESEVADFKWHFFNADGSLAEMCGNGARCVARFAYMHGIASANMRFETLAGIVEARVADVNVTIKMPQPHSLQLSTQLAVGDDGTIEIHSLDTGVPHVVCFVEDVDKVDVKAMGRAIRYHDDFQPAGTNVNFVSLAGGGLKVRTYERGVEDETLACGTGATASAIVASLLNMMASPVEIMTTGNNQLKISFEAQGEEGIDNVLLKGPAHVIYKGELSPEALEEL